MHREPVGRACGKGDGRRVQDGGLARPRAETAMGKRLGLRYRQNFLIVYLAETDVARFISSSERVYK